MTETTYTLIETLNARARELEAKLSRYEQGFQFETVVYEGVADSGEDTGEIRDIESTSSFN